MALLLLARILVAAVPFRLWREGLGTAGDPEEQYENRTAERLAADVEWAAGKIPVSTDCLPRAMALSWMLRKRRVPHAVVFAVRPSSSRTDKDGLHAWVEVRGTRLIGDLPGPWIETLRLDGEPRPT